MADTPTGETVAPTAPSNETGNTNTPPQVNVSADVEAAKREAEQAKIRANQLANENAKLKADQEAAHQRQLEEKEEFKTLYEQTQSKLKEIEDAQSERERQTQLNTSTEDLFKDYPPNVVELAKTAGLGLSDDSDAAKAALKEKLDAFKEKVGSVTPSANNPRQTTPQQVNRGELVTRQNRFEGSAMSQASAKGDDSLVRKYISDLPAIQRMKEIASNGA
jgi:hypothetical protein